MSDFKPKIQSKSISLGLRPGPRWGSLQHFPALFKGPSNGRRVERIRDRRKGRVKEGRLERKEKEEWKWKYSFPPLRSYFDHWSIRYRIIKVRFWHCP